MSAPRIILASLPSFCQKLSKLVEIRRRADKNNFAVFLRHGVVWYRNCGCRHLDLVLTAKPKQSLRITEHLLLAQTL